MTDALESVLAIAGEPSGDLHGAKVVAKLGELDPRVRVFGIGGDRMRAAGMDLVRHADEFSVVGFAEIVRHLPRLRRAMDEIVHVALERSTRLAVLIDYPGFNLMLARRLRASGVRVLYYISPQVWAWAEGRVRKIAERVDRMAVILPFEVGFYRERGVDVEFVGHPLLEEPWVAAVRGPKRGLGDERTLGLLPGSRRQEVSRHAGVMLGAARLLSDRVPGLRVAIGLAPGIDREDVLESAPVASADLAARGRPGRAAGSGVEFVASGTATLEAACAGTPMVITYRTSALSYSLAKSLVRIPYIGLVNVIAGEEIVPEAVQSEATPERLASLVEPYLVDAELATETSARLFRVRESLGEPGASDRVARMVLDMLAGAAR
jgi:lipid-A-disaccharide synthase